MGLSTILYDVACEEGGTMHASTRRDLKLGTVAIIAIAATSFTGQLATYPNLVPWYAGLSKPSFNPPDWVFAPTWTSLYALTGFALWRVLRQPASIQRGKVLTLIACMLILNAAWSWMFFAANSPLLGLINIGPQLAVIFATIAACWRLDRLAALCLLPLLGWVAFAAVLNFSIWSLNG